MELHSSEMCLFCWHMMFLSHALEKFLIFWVQTLVFLLCIMNIPHSILIIIIMHMQLKKPTNFSLFLKSLLFLFFSSFIPGILLVKMILVCLLILKLISKTDLHYFICVVLLLKLSLLFCIFFEVLLVGALLLCVIKIVKLKITFQTFVNFT